MDLTDIANLSSRKRMATDGYKIGEKMSRVSSNLIKTRVAQDTAYSDLMEKYKTLEAEHERLRQNMLAVTMQNEAITAELQEEQRLRPETLNKLNATREICDALEEQLGRVRASVQRSAAARAELAAAYDDAARRVQAAHMAHARAMQDAEMRAHALAEQLKLSEEHNARIATCSSEAQRQAEAAVQAARDQVQAANAVAEDMRTRRAELAETVARLEIIVEERDKTIAEHRQELGRFVAEAKTEFARGRQTIADLEKKLENKGASLAAAETRAETAAGEAARTAEALSASDARNKLLSEETTQLRTTIQNLESNIADLKQELTSFGAKNEALSKKVGEKDLEVHDLKSSVASMLRDLNETRAQLAETTASLQAARSEYDSEREARARDAASAQAELRAHSEESASAAAAAERELSTRADTIARIMRDLAEGAEARARCDSALIITRADLEGATTARDSAQERVRSLEHKLKGKDEELAKQMRIILESRSEKERLQSVIRNMQSTIDNIHKELSRDTNTTAAAASSSRHQPPEHDDNALPAPPTPLTRQAKPKPVHGDPLIFNFHSDSSMEGVDAVDSVKVKARLESLARGSTTPVPLRALLRERRRDDTVRDNSQAQGRFFKNKRRDNTKDMAKKNK